MRCNACWQEVEGRAVTTTCGHVLCTEDASKILSNNAACPICDQVLSKSLMKSVDINPSDEWTNMAMAGISPQILMKTAYKSVMFFIGQKELEMQFKMNRLMAQCRQKCESMQEKFTEKLEQVHTAYQKMAQKCQILERTNEKFTEKLEQVHSAYQKMAQKCQIMEQESERLSKDNQELQEKLADKTRQKRKLDEMYDQLRSEYDSVKRIAIQPAPNFYSRPDPDFFGHTSNLDMMGSGDPIRKDGSVFFRPQTPGPSKDLWPAPARQNSSGLSVPFDLSGGSPLKPPTMPLGTSSRKVDGNPNFGGGAANPSMSLRNLIFSPIKRPQPPRDGNRLFSL